MTERPRATEIPDLVRRLASRRQAVVDTARARLCIHGARAVEHLIEAIEGDNNRIRAHAMPLLALIQDARGREPLVAMLLDRDLRMRELAARCLARFPSRDSVAALESLLKKEKQHEVRIAAVQALIEQYVAGQERAICQVLAILLDTADDSRVRVCALALLPTLRPAERRGILRRLRQDPAAAVARRAAEVEEGSDPPGSKDPGLIRSFLRDLASPDYAVWNEAVHRIASRGVTSIDPLIQEMQRRSHDPEYCIRAGMALKALGPRRGRALADALERLEDSFPLQVLVEVIGALGEKSLIYRLKDLIARIAARSNDARKVNGFDPLQRVRAKAHLEMARIGSRVAADDLRLVLRDSNRRIELEILEAAEMIGKRDEILDLLQAYAREDRYVRERIGRVVCAIMKRERIRRNSRMFKTLGPVERRAMENILTSLGKGRPK